MVGDMYWIRSLSKGRSSRVWMVATCSDLLPVAGWDLDILDKWQKGVVLRPWKRILPRVLAHIGQVRLHPCWPKRKIGLVKVQEVLVQTIHKVWRDGVDRHCDRKYRNKE